LATPEDRIKWLREDVAASFSDLVFVLINRCDLDDYSGKLLNEAEQRLYQEIPE
jgi:hypothetical protein